VVEVPPVANARRVGQILTRQVYLGWVPHRVDPLPAVRAIDLRHRGMEPPRAARVQVVNMAIRPVLGV